MAYDLIRWGLGALLFVILSIILVRVTKKKGKSLLISSFTALIVGAVLLLFPFENLFYSFGTVEDIFSYRHHENFVAAAECNSGVLTVGNDKDGENVYYTFKKDAGGYKLNEKDNITIRSSTHGIYIFANFGNDSIILTYAENSAYNGENFTALCDGLSYYALNDENFSPSKLTSNGEKVNLV